jgi:hypothetical protein
VVAVHTNPIQKLKDLCLGLVINLKRNRRPNMKVRVDCNGTALIFLPTDKGHVFSHLNAGLMSAFGEIAIPENEVTFDTAGDVNENTGYFSNNRNRIPECLKPDGVLFRVERRLSYLTNTHLDVVIMDCTKENFLETYQDYNFTVGHFIDATRKESRRYFLGEMSKVPGLLKPQRNFVRSHIISANTDAHL